VKTQKYLAAHQPTRASLRTSKAVKYRNSNGSDLDSEDGDENEDESGDIGPSYSGSNASGKTFVWKKQPNAANCVQVDMFFRTQRRNLRTLSLLFRIW
jgi:hypothetical protein